MNIKLIFILTMFVKIVSYFVFPDHIIRARTCVYFWWETVIFRLKSYFQWGPVQTYSSYKLASNVLHKIQIEINVYFMQDFWQ